MKGEDGKPNNSPAACKKFCDGFKYYGVQARNQCFCGDKLNGALKKMPESQCRDVCPGDATQKCGAGGRMNLYEVLPGTNIFNFSTFDFVFKIWTKMTIFATFS